MQQETIDLRHLLLTIQEQKEMNAAMALEFDCKIPAADVGPLVKVINYAINWVSRLTDQQIQISLNAGRSGIMMGFTAFTSADEFPEINPQVVETLQPYSAIIENKSQPAKYAQLLITFNTPSAA